MKCSKCGGDKFYAVQKIEKYDTVIVDANGKYVDESNGQFAHPDEDSCSDCDKPTGPYFCVRCREEVKDNDC